MADRLRSWVDICRESDADLVLDHYVLYNRTWPFFVLAARTLGVSTIGFLQSYSLRPIRDDNANTSFLVQNLPLLAMVVTLSATDVAYWKLLGVERVVQLPHPPSPMLLERATRTGPKPAPAGPIRLVWWGRLQQSTKQIRDLIPITAALRARGVDVELTIIGPDTSDLTAARLMADAVAQGVSDIVNLPGPLHGQALIDALLEADVYVFTSVIEGSPLALIEAQSLGLPVVMYDLPWLANLDDNEGIVTVGQGDVRGFAREIQLLVEDPDRYVALSAGSLEAAQRATQLDFAALYTQLLTGDLPTAHSPEPTLSNARILLEWMVFYAELNARRHESQSKQIAALRARVTTLRKEASTARSKFLGQRRVTVELRQQLQEGRGALRIGRRAKRLVTRASRKAQSLLKGSASTQAVSRESVVILTEELTPQDRPVHTAGVGGQSVHATSEVAGAISGPDGISQSQPDVTVVIPIYNAGPWLDQCLSSVLSQSGVDLEVIGVNDGSTDDSRSILGRHAQQDSRVRIIDQANSGQSVGRNAGLDAATGRYVIFLDSDDFWAQDALSTLVRRADDDELDVLLLEGHSLRDGDVTEEVWDRYGSYYPRKHEYAEVRSGADMIVDMRRGRDYKAHVGLYLTRTSYAQAIGARFIPGIVHQDNPYTFALLLNAARVAHTKTDLYARRLRPGSTITTLQAVRSAKGYYLSYISMLRAVTSRDLPPEVANVLSNIVYEVFDSALDQFVQLPVSIGAELKKLDPSSDAQVAFRMLVSSRERVLAAARSDHSARHAQASAPEGIATATS